MRGVRLLVVTGLVGLLLTGATAAAQTIPGAREGDQAGLKIAPTKYEQSIEPGKPMDGVVDVFNLSQGNLTVQPGVENVRMMGEAGDLEFYVGDNPYRLHSFVEIDKSPFVLGPGEARRVKFRITIPAGVFPGGYFGAVVFTVVPPDQPGTAEGTIIKQSGRVGTLLILTVGTEQDRKGEFRSFRSAGGVFGEAHRFAASYANTGNTDQRPLGVAYRPKGTLTVKNVLGVTVAKRDLEGELVFPGAERGFVPDVKKAFWFGPYTAELRLAPGEGPAETKTVRFWAVSWPAVAVLGTLILIVLLLTRLRRRRPQARHRSRVPHVNLHREESPREESPEDRDQA